MTLLIRFSPLLVSEHAARLARAVRPARMPPVSFVGYVYRCHRILLPPQGREQGVRGRPSGFDAECRTDPGQRRGATGSSVPSSANSQTWSPFAEAANMLPAAYATTYCLPS